MASDTIEYKISSLPIGKSEKLLLFVLKEYGAFNDPVGFTVAELADKASGSRNTIVKSVKDLEEAGYIKVREGEGRQSNNYRILTDRFKTQY